MDAARVFFDNEKHIGGILRRYGVPDQDVEDVAHNVFVRIAKSIARASAAFRGDAQVGTWVYTIAKREALMYHRANRRHLARLDRSASSEDVDVADDAAPDADAVIDGGRDAAVVRAAMERVDERARMVLRLYYFDGVSSEEIGRMLGVKEQTGKTIVFRARAKLARVLERLAA